MVYFSNIIKAFMCSRELMFIFPKKFSGFKFISIGPMNKRLCVFESNHLWPSLMYNRLFHV